eukprot:61126-Chlamydomonas_euryale.AAC.1
MRTLPVKSGDVLAFRTGADFWYLFCLCRGTLFVNMVPCSPRGLSTLTRDVLSRMGNTPRGWNAHRKGCPTRVLQRELLKSGGKAGFGT